MAKDWTGDFHSIYTTLGASNHTEGERQEHDFYATEPRATEELLELEKFSKNIWEPSCGAGHMSKVLEKAGYNVYSSDLYDYGYGKSGLDFLACTAQFDGDIITNPPYKYALQFVEKALELVPAGHKVCMFLKLSFLEGKQRRKLFDRNPPIRVWVSSSRLKCAKNGDFNSIGSSAAAYAWFVWEKGHTGACEVKWFN